ncbi:unnamed protein product [Mycena citricolor]|uniref:Uncharacterized protein n=1 Tax=Mycena citricolor TaxID=2018698 RepID=A0AAD2H741_9AGAR|nr:unnamed protein product [Mycena citricolor]
MRLVQAFTGGAGNAGGETQQCPINCSVRGSALATGRSKAIWAPGTPRKCRVITYSGRGDRQDCRRHPQVRMSCMRGGPRPVGPRISTHRIHVAMLLCRSRRMAG